MKHKLTVLVLKQVVHIHRVKENAEALVGATKEMD